MRALRYFQPGRAVSYFYHHISVRPPHRAAQWSSADALWRVTAERGPEREPVVLTCSFLMSCTGYYRYDHGHQPDFAGLDRYQGTLIHPQHWPEDLDHTSKRVVVIGSGATAVTLLPALAERAAHVTMLQRSPGYVASVPQRHPLARLLRRTLPERWSSPIIRWALTSFTQGSVLLEQAPARAGQAGPPQGAGAFLPPGYDIDTHFTPSYDPWDQRLCAVPDGDLFKAIRAGTASVVTDHIDTFTESGIRLRVRCRVRGRHRGQRHRSRPAVHGGHGVHGRR